MSDNKQNKSNQECKCSKELKKQVAELGNMVAELRKEVAVLRKAVRK